ncbi:hypothetical protein L6452_22457 [Arctium lappa]|uniref:Uncharacterized protein n=1 Tax=Arctium lappa TaxID=4217 RepID=A0ACB9AZF1_ARCLA|nr:hypothetical protein L6452_22457 [Arctium lappa]
MDIFMLYMLTSRKKALAHGGITEALIGEMDKIICGVLICSIMGGMKDMMLFGGSDAVIIPIGLGGFVACRTLSERNNDPAKGS